MNCGICGAEKNLIINEGFYPVCENCNTVHLDNARTGFKELGKYAPLLGLDVSESVKARLNSILASATITIPPEFFTRTRDILLFDYIGGFRPNDYLTVEEVAESFRKVGNISPHNLPQVVDVPIDLVTKTVSPTARKLPVKWTIETVRPYAGNETFKARSGCKGPDCLICKNLANSELDD